MKSGAVGPIKAVVQPERTAAFVQQHRKHIHLNFAVGGAANLGGPFVQTGGGQNFGIEREVVEPKTMSRKRVWLIAR